MMAAFQYSVKRVEGKSGALRRVITDTVDIWSVIDREKAGEIGVKFVAGNPNRLPGVNAEKFNLQFLITAITKLQETVESQTTELSQLKTLIDSKSSNENKGKRKLSGSADPFTPKRLIISGGATVTPSPAHTATPLIGATPSAPNFGGDSSVTPQSGRDSVSFFTPNTGVVSSSSSRSGAKAHVALSVGNDPSLSTNASNGLTPVANTGASTGAVVTPVSDDGAASVPASITATPVAQESASGSNAAGGSKPTSYATTAKNGWIEVQRKRNKIIPIKGSLDVNRIQ